jgi:hypothetical protein
LYYKNLTINGLPAAANKLFAPYPARQAKQSLHPAFYARDGERIAQGY